MEQLFSLILKTSLSGAVVIGAILCLRPVLKKAPGTVLCLMWFLAVLRLLIPFEISSPVSLQPEPARISQAIAVQTQAVPVTGAVLEKEGNLLPFLWLAAALVLGVLSIRSYGKLKNQVREAWRTEDGCWEASSIDTAFVLGFFRPQIYMPTALREQDRRFVLSHEQWHIRLLHHVLKPLGYLALCLHWFNPIVWLGYRVMCADLEMACDEQVIRDMDVNQRKAYSETLLNFCTPKRLSGYFVAFGGSDPKRRILSVLHYKKPGFWMSLTGVAAMVFVAVCLMTSPNASAQTMTGEPGIVCMTTGCTDPSHDHSARDCTAANCGEDDYHHTYCGDENCSICLARLKALVKEFADQVDSLEQEYVVKYGYLHQDCTDPDHEHGGYYIITQGCEDDSAHAGCTDENCETCANAEEACSWSSSTCEDLENQQQFQQEVEECIDVISTEPCETQSQHHENSHSGHHHGH